MDLHFSFLLLFIFHLSTTTTATNNDTAALSLFRLHTDLHGILLSNWTTKSTPCSGNWFGIKCTNNRVTAITLPSLNLRGPIIALSDLDQLHLLDLQNNRLNSTVTPITKCQNLKLVYLANNDFSGEIPPGISSLHRLLRLDLSNNNLRGTIPIQMSNLTKLLTLHLQNNEISGIIPEFLDTLPHLKELNLSNNELYGNIPKKVMSRFGEVSFFGNEGLCGNFTPFPKCSYTGKQGNMQGNPNSPSSQIVQSNPSSFPSSSTSNSSKTHHKKLGKAAIVATIVTVSVILLVIASFLMAYSYGKYSMDTSSLSGSEKRRSSYSGEKRVYANNVRIDSDGTNATDKSKLVFFDRKKQFDLDDLLKASAELLGKGSLGTVYRAVLEDGGTVAVKRLKDANPCARKEFEEYMDVIGKMKHPNVVRFRAYYYAREEKLLIYDFMYNGSLHSLLHGFRGAGRIPLDWTTRISLILGAARGLARIHQQYAASRIPHGNIKSSNILLDKVGNACISDFGLSLLLNPVHAIARLGGYRAPEQTENKKLSQMADVYSFGVLVLEVLTGRDPSGRTDEAGIAVDLPKWVQSVVRDEWTAEVFDEELLRYKNIEEELVSMLHVAMACVVLLPENRPVMSEVVKMIEEIRVEQSPSGDDYDVSRSSMSPSLAATDDALV